MSKTTNKFSPEVRECAVRLVLDNEGQHGSRWQAVMSISAKIGCAPQTLPTVTAGGATRRRFDNPRRRHSKLGYLSPMKFEAHAMLA